MKLNCFCALLAVLLLPGVRSQQLTDMGDCACVCGLDSRGHLASGVETGDSFLHQVRGPKGEIGRPGKPGPVGSPGTTGLRGPPGPQGISGGRGGDNFAESCFAYREDGSVNSGVYTIKPSPSSASIEVYCDMATAGGGWTLVASVHENNIKGKCTLGDRWSSDQNTTNPHYNGTRNWENLNVFGSVESATSDDYKSPAYFNVLSTDVMIWHVPNDVEINEWPAQAFLKYYTNNGFLSNYGGTLQTLFSKYYPLRVSQSSGTAFLGLTTVLASLNRSASEIRGAVSSFYKYNYDYSGVQNYISDGGRDMFDSGNKVYYQIGTKFPRLITYRKTYRDDANNVVVSSSTEHPFITLMWVGNPQRTISNFGIKVESGTGADNSGLRQSDSGDIAYGNFLLKYHYYNVYSAGDPSISEVFFYIASVQTWNSVPPTSFTKERWPTGTDGLVNTVRANGSPRNILMGYTLLSKNSGTNVYESEIRSALLRIMQTISGFQSISGQNCSRLSDSLVVPISYADRSSDDTILSHVPPSFREDVTPGYIQFRPMSPTGVPNAFCPGYKTSSCHPGSVCVGGVNTLALGDTDSCGDFAAWDGNRRDSPTATTPDGEAHSLNDIDSSILIFTRAGTASKQTNP